MDLVADPASGSDPGLESEEREMDVYQCPACELRFRNANEQLDHIATDHPGFQAEATSEENQLIGASHLHRRRRKASGPDTNAP